MGQWVILHSEIERSELSRFILYSIFFFFSKFLFFFGPQNVQSNKVTKLTALSLFVAPLFVLFSIFSFPSQRSVSRLTYGLLDRRAHLGSISYGQPLLSNESPMLDEPGLVHTKVIIWPF